MRREVVVLDPAAKELDSAVGWYDVRRAGWGERLLVEVRVALDMLADGFDGSPDPISEQAGVRRVLLRRFPFAVVFAPSAGRVEVIAFAHLRRMPEYWRRRR